MCRRLCACSLPKVPHQFAALSRWERVLFALAVGAAIAVNGWLLHRNLQRMWEAERSPVSQISQLQVDQFPDFIITVTAFASPAPIQCIETCQFIANGSIVDRRSCNMQAFITPFGNHVFIITPLRRFLPTDPVFRSSLDIHYKNVSSSQFSLCVMDPSQRDRFLYTTWTPFDACHHFAADDNKEYVFGLDASATQFPNNTKQFEFRLNEAFAGYDRSFIRFVNQLLNPSVALNKLTVDYQLVDVATSTGSFLSVTMVVFAFLFPTDNPQYRFRFHRGRSTKRADAQEDLDDEGSIQREYSGLESLRGRREDEDNLV